MQTRRSGWFLCCGFGVAVAIVAAVIMPMFPKEGAGYPPGLGDPIFAFEMATTPEDLTLVFGEPEDPLRPTRVAAMDQGNRWDYLFMVAYGGFLCSFFVAAQARSGRAVWLIPAVLAVLAALSDAIENVILLGLTAELEAAPGVQWLCYPVWVKFMALMICGVAASIFVRTSGHFFWRWTGLLMLPGSLTILAAFVAPSTFGWSIGQGLGCVWVLQLVYAVVQAIDSKRTPTVDVPVT